MQTFKKSKGDAGYLWETIGGIDIRWPKMPARKTIDGHGLNKKEQFFRRTKLPASFSRLNRDINGNIRYTHEQQMFINQEFSRILDGYWFYNNGYPTYVTGAHYFELCWFPIDVGYKEYRDRDRRVHLHWKHCAETETCYGQIYLKHRRDGATYRANSVNYLTAITNRNCQTGIQSKTGEDAAKVFRKLVQSWRKLPAFLQPIFEGNTNPKTALRFSEPADRVTKKNRTVKSSVALDSEITFKPTNPEAYDGTKLLFYHYDECGKITDYDCNDTWAIVMQCLTLGSKIVGKTMMTSTVAEMEKKGGKFFKKLYLQSNPNEVNEYGRTLSGLYKLFIPAYDGMEGFIDKHGFSRQEEAKAFLEARREQFRKEGDQVGLQEFKRLYPFTEKEALTGAANQCEFDIEKIDDQIAWLDSLPQGEKPYVIGNFEWENGRRDTRITFRPQKNGKFKVAWQPKSELSEMNQVDRTGTRHDQISEGSSETYARPIYKPTQQMKYVASCDPFDHDVVKFGKGSKGGFYVYKKYDMLAEDATRNDCFIVQYLHRPPTAKMFMKMC